MAFAYWKSCGLNAYYWATLRRAPPCGRERAERETEPVRVLFYHRVADEHPNDWTMSTDAVRRSKSTGCGQRFDLVSLAEAQSRIASGRNRCPLRASRSTTVTPTTCVLPCRC